MAMIIAVITLGMASCGSEDDEPESSDIDYLEVTVNGETKTIEFPKGFGLYLENTGFADASGKEMSLLMLGGSVVLGRIGTLTMPIAVYTYKSGTYNFRPITKFSDSPYTFFDDDWWQFVYEHDDIKKPFETAILIESSGSEYYSANGSLKVNSVKQCQISFQGKKSEAYTIEATFTSKLVNKNDKNDKKDCTGKFSLTISPDDD